SAALIGRICQSRQAPRLGGNYGDTLTNTAGCSGFERNLARIRGKRLVRHWRSEKYAGRGYPKTEQASQRQHRRSEISSAACQSRRRRAWGVARRFLRADFGG